MRCLKFQIILIGTATPIFYVNVKRLITHFISCTKIFLYKWMPSIKRTSFSNLVKKVIFTSHRLMSCFMSLLVRLLLSIVNFPLQLITQAPSNDHDHTSSARFPSQWLPYPFQMYFNVSLLIHKVLNAQPPRYLFSLMQPFASSRSLRSKYHLLLALLNIQAGPKG